MVTEAKPVLNQDQSDIKIDLEPKPVLGLRQVGDLIGIPIVVRPWWGSRRQLYIRRHRKCGHNVMQDLYGSGRWWCFQCSRHVAANEIEIVRCKPGRWLCPAGYTQQLKWPTVEGNKVVMWEGRCGARYSAGPRKRYGSETHTHSQVLEVLDFSPTAMLVRVSVRSRRLNFLIGRDDGHPFVHVVTKTQTTVASAYDYLVPTPVFNAQMHGVDVKRQGDWFFVPLNFFRKHPVKNEEKRVRPWPGRRDAAMASYDHGTIYSNAPIENTRHIADRLIWAWPYDLVRGIVKAPDHPQLQLDTWHCAIRNKRPCAFNPDINGYVD